MLAGNAQTVAATTNRRSQSRFIGHIIADHDRPAALANRTCPAGYNFYGDSPVGSSRKGEHTYTFQCNG